ncbi:MAG: DUF5717 family protein [Lachnospiraceae bacterium]|nr:DUF5717 family protein [Lachnospiraceae bacterium]
MSLSFSVKRIEETCEVKGRVEGSFIIHAYGCRRLAFMLRCSHRRISLSITDYNDVITDDGIEVRYAIDAYGFDPGIVYKGYISVVSDQGEDRIPVTLSVIKEEIVTSSGVIRNLFHFTNLAKENFDEAVRLFYTEDAKRIFESGDHDIYFKYRAFSACEETGRKYEGVEEFLVESGKKNPVLLNFAEASVMIRHPLEDATALIPVRKSGWGYAGFTVSSTDDFVEFEKTEYGNDDFEGNFSEITVRIVREKLHVGHNFARVDLKSLHSSISIPIFVDMTDGDRSAREKRRSRNAAIVKLMNEFINFRIGNVSGAEWISNSNKLLERLLILDRNDPESRLMQAQLLLAAKRYGEADIVLGAVEREMDQREFSDELMAYYLYLRAMCDRNDKDLKETVREVWDLYDRSGGSWRILWILIYLDETIKMSPERERALIEEQVMHGMRSPLMYLEAYSILSHDPSLIRSLSEFEINVLVFAVHNGLLKKEIEDQVALLSQRMRGFDPRLIKIMGAFYSEFEDDEMLISICSYLIRNEITDSRYSGYFEKAVERELGVTNLYDYYLYTMKQSSTKLLPKSILMYYSFQNELAPELRAYVYANMIVNEEEAGPYLDECLDECAKFAASEIIKGNMDENLAIIVDYLKYFRKVEDETLDRVELDKAIVNRAFLRLITVHDPSIRSVIVVEDAFKDSRVAAVRSGRAYISIYDNDYELFFEDADGRRFGERYVAFEEIKLIRSGDLPSDIIYPQTDDPGLWVALSEMGRSYISIDEDNETYVKAMLEHDGISEGFKDGVLTSLLRYYFDNDMSEELNALLERTDVSMLTMEERNEYVRFCSIRGDNEESYRIISEYGAYGIEPRILMRIATRCIEEDPDDKDPVLLEIVSATFKGNKYNEDILGYISKYYEGTTRELKDIWRACLDFDSDPTVIEGRLIEQMLATGAYIGDRDEVFFHYLMGVPSKHVVGEYFRKAAEDNFLRDTLLDDRLFIGLLDYSVDEEISDIEALCLIRFFESRRDLRSDRILFPYIRGLAERDMVFDFFIPYKDLLPSLELYADDVFIEYRTSPGARVVLNYSLDPSETEPVEFRSELMKEVYPGVYQSRGNVFPGEYMQYYITVNDNGPTRSDIEYSEERLSNGDSRYEILQDAITSLNMGDSASFTELAEDYIVKDRIVREVIWAES